MRRKAARFSLVGVVVLIALIALMAVVMAIRSHNIAEMAPQTAAVAQAKPNPPTRAQLLALVNQERIKYGVAPLKEDHRLDTSAQEKANDEQEYNYFGHISPKTHTANFIDYIDQTGISCKTDSENLVDNLPPNSTAQGAVQAWIISPPHHKAMIDPDYGLTGFGINGYEVVEHFCQI